ncbi:MAG: DUF6069 family protein [Egibacteraceae bacterium]
MAADRNAPQSSTRSGVTEPQPNPAVPQATTSPGTRRRARLLAVVSTILAALALWTVAEPILGVDLREPARAAGGATRAIGPLNIVLASAVASLAGWGLLAALERLTVRARTAWTATAVVVALVSLGGPLSGAGITAANKVVLALLHIVVAAVLIPLLSRTSPQRR